jgi:transcriptional regulator with XRE-family HTH domain
MESCGNHGRTERNALETEEENVSIVDLKAARQIADLSQFQVARLTGVSRTRLSLAENSDVELKPEALALIRDVLREHLSVRAREIGFLCSLASPPRRKVTEG